MSAVRQHYPKCLDDPDAIIHADQELSLIRLLVSERGAAFRHGILVGQRQGLSPWHMGAGSDELRQWHSGAAMGGRLPRSPFRSSVTAGAWVARGRCSSWTNLTAPDIAAFLVARDLASLWSLHQELLPDHPSVPRTTPALPEQDGMELLRDLYPCQIRTRQPHSGLTLDPATFQTPFHSANRVTRAQCERHCRDLINRRKQRLSLSDRVRDFLLTRGDNLPTLGEVASVFHQSERSCAGNSRWKGPAGASFGTKYWSDRPQAAVREQFDRGTGGRATWLHRTLSFSHAFKRWTGLSPCNSGRPGFAQHRAGNRRPTVLG